MISDFELGVYGGDEIVNVCRAGKTEWREGMGLLKALCQNK